MTNLVAAAIWKPLAASKYRIRMSGKAMMVVDEFGDGVSRHRGDYCSPDGFRNALCLTVRYSDLGQSGALFAVSRR